MWIGKEIRKIDTKNYSYRQEKYTKEKFCFNAREYWVKSMEAKIDS